MIPSKSGEPIPNKYFMLMEGDRIAEGDEYYNPFADRWVPVNQMINTFGHIEKDPDAEDCIGKEWHCKEFKPMRRKNESYIPQGATGELSYLADAFRGEYIHDAEFVKNKLERLAYLIRFHDPIITYPISQLIELLDIHRQPYSERARKAKLTEFISKQRLEASSGKKPVYKTMAATYIGVFRELNLVLDSQLDAEAVDIVSTLSDLLKPYLEAIQKYAGEVKMKPQPIPATTNSMKIEKQQEIISMVMHLLTKSDDPSETIQDILEDACSELCLTYDDMKRLRATLTLRDSEADSIQLPKNFSDRQKFKSFLERTQWIELDPRELIPFI